MYVFFITLPESLNYKDLKNVISRYEIDQFTVVGLVAWPLNGSEAATSFPGSFPRPQAREKTLGTRLSEAAVDLVLIQTSLLLLCKSSCSYDN